MGVTATVGLGFTAASAPATAIQGSGSYYDVGSAALTDYYVGRTATYKGESGGGHIEGVCGGREGSPAVGYVFTFDDLWHQTVFNRDANLPAPVPNQQYVIQNGKICDEEIYGAGNDAHLHQFIFRPANGGKGNGNRGR